MTSRVYVFTRKLLSKHYTLYLVSIFPFTKFSYFQTHTHLLLPLLDVIRCNYLLPLHASIAYGNINVPITVLVELYHLWTYRYCRENIKYHVLSVTAYFLVTIHIKCCKVYQNCIYHWRFRIEFIKFYHQRLHGGCVMLLGFKQIM